MHVLSARGSELERVFSFGVARQLLDLPTAMLAPDPLFGDEPFPEGDRPGLAVIRRLFDAVAELTGARGEGPGGALLITVDDAQWADEPSLRFLGHLALRIAELPTALVVAVRLGEPGTPEHLLTEILDAPGNAVLRPRALSPSAVETLVRKMLGRDVDDALAAACGQASAGNPFYLTELLRALAEGGGRPTPERIRQVAPAGVLRAIMVRLGRLGREGPALAKALAILGDGTPLRLVARLAALDEPRAESAADALARARILRDGDPLAFAHPLIGSALATDMGGFERARAHAKAAELLIEEEAPAQRVAEHLFFARPANDTRVPDVLADAAAYAVSSGDPGTAVRLLRRALDEPPSPRDRPGIMLALAKAEALAGSPEASARLDEALELVKDGARRADALSEQATLAHHQGEFGRAQELARRASRELPRGEPGRERLVAIELSAAMLDPEGQERRRALLEPILAGARGGHPPRDPTLLAIVVAELAVGDPPELVRELAETAIAGDPLVDRSYGGSIGWIGSALIWVDELEASEHWLDAALEVAERRGAVIAGAVAFLQRAWVHYLRGRLDQAVADAERALEIYRYGWTSSPWSTPILASAHVARGHFDAAREALAIGEEAGPARPEYALLLEAEARLHLAEYDPSSALAKARGAAAHAEGTYGNVQPRVWEWRRLAATAAHRLGDFRAGRELIAPDLQALREIGPRRQLGAAMTVAGLLAEGEEGRDLLARAAAVLERSPSRLQRLETLLELGGALRRAGHRNAAKEPLYQALELAAEIGATYFERRAREELASLGLRPRRAARSGLASLTPSERRVAALAGQGLTTPQITQALRLARNTVETHLSHVYRKLDVSGRRDLPEVLEQSREEG